MGTPTRERPIPHEGDTPVYELMPGFSLGTIDSDQIARLIAHLLRNEEMAQLDDPVWDEECPNRLLDATEGAEVALSAYGRMGKDEEDSLRALLDEAADLKGEEVRPGWRDLLIVFPWSAEGRRRLLDVVGKKQV